MFLRAWVGPSLAHKHIWAWGMVILGILVVILGKGGRFADQRQ